MSAAAFLDMYTVSENKERKQDRKKKEKKGHEGSGHRRVWWLNLEQHASVF